jgi:hypothetical protein
MRSILILLTLACMPAICQENANPTPDSAAQGISGTVPQVFSDTLRILRVVADKPAVSTCSIPLINVKAPGTPVPMPNMMPKVAVPPNQTSPGPKPIDNMKIVAPAPACPADFSQVSVPRTTP